MCESGGLSQDAYSTHLWLKELTHDFSIFFASPPFSNTLPWEDLIYVTFKVSVIQHRLEQHYSPNLTWRFCFPTLVGWEVVEGKFYAELLCENEF